MNPIIISVCAACVLVLAACGGANNPEATPGGVPSTDAPARAVEAYITAKVGSDRDQLAQLICSELESRLDAEAASFSAVEASIDGMSCQTDEGGATVTCAGQIVAVYNGENRDFPLGTYSVVEEDGAWKWCGEAAQQP